jgi:fermentation-respiration switch protein FrsA (DUF1100 family)
MALLVALFGIQMAAWNWLAEKVIFQPTPGIDLRPEMLGIEGHEVFLTSGDGTRLHGFFVASPAATRAILFLHGNAGNASHRLPNAAELAQLGTAVLVPDYRGYGMSEGTPSEAGCYADARAALEDLVGRGFPENRIVLFGRSLGAAVAVDLAQDRELAGVILESAFTSGADVAKRAFGSPIALLMQGVLASDAKIDRVRAPLLFFHGDRDQIIDFELGRALYDIAPEPKSFETIAGAGHNDTTQVGGRAYFERIRVFLDQVAPETRENTP